MKFTCENLEQRRLLAASIVNPGPDGILTIDGDGSANTIDVSVSGNDVVVVIDGGAPQAFDLPPTFDDGEYHHIVVNGGDGNDTITLTPDVFSGPGDTGITLNGGDGDDEITAGNGDDTITGGAGDDTLHGGNGNDSMVGGAGADDFDGGDNNDTVSYESSSADLTVTIDDTANDGASGESDNVFGNVETVGRRQHQRDRHFRWPHVGGQRRQRHADRRERRRPAHRRHGQ
jgi:Ca2+-binding RTX toxin-like protein